MNRKHLDADVVQATGIRSATAKTLSPNIATTPALPTEQLLAQHVSRKSMSHAQIWNKVDVHWGRRNIENTYWLHKKIFNNY